MRRAHRIALPCLAALAFAASAWVAGFRVNETRSLPQGLWRVTETHALHRGDVAFFCPPNRPVFREARARGYLHWSLACITGAGIEPLFKPVVAVSGDRVRVAREGVYVNDVLLPNTAPILSDGRGRPLRPLFGPERTLAPGELWLVSDYHPASFDSRYFGAIDERAVIGRAAPVWTTP